MISLREDSGDAMRSSFELEIEKMFSADGRLSAVSNYEYRPEQERMACQVARTLQSGGSSQKPERESENQRGLCSIRLLIDRTGYPPLDLLEFSPACPGRDEDRQSSTAAEDCRAWMSNRTR
jgi:hypothetical protein